MPLCFFSLHSEQINSFQGDTEYKVRNRKTICSVVFLTPYISRRTYWFKCPGKMYDLTKLFIIISAHRQNHRQKMNYCCGTLVVVSLIHVDQSLYTIRKIRELTLKTYIMRHLLIYAHGFLCSKQSSLIIVPHTIFWRTLYTHNRNNFYKYMSNIIYKHTYINI